MRFKIGDRVRVKGVRGSALITRRLKGIPGGVALSKRLDYFAYWNTSELLPYRRPTEGRSAG